jgi:hypothetical protein
MGCAASIACAQSKDDASNKLLACVNRSMQISAPDINISCPNANQSCKKTAVTENVTDKIKSLDFRLDDRGIGVRFSAENMHFFSPKLPCRLCSQPRLHINEYCRFVLRGLKTVGS